MQKLIVGEQLAVLSPDCVKMAPQDRGYLEIYSSLRLKSLRVTLQKVQY